MMLHVRGPCWQGLFTSQQATSCVTGADAREGSLGQQAAGSAAGASREHQGVVDRHRQLDVPKVAGADLALQPTRGAPAQHGRTVRLCSKQVPADRTEP